ncbi:PulJ/GspJ family protein [Mucisphaera calidilacus]|uniref:Prepilin-type N-terminal cleavage/methylation domain-containing protein n=1 Tax=Mucisphaera calidilacus TaxID=2527982 RepID=A0A518BXF6_9BACT|nr:prepilin-type N-terminal cleavage/methylation domain-containing protein [Mucisphaera calidilacus]QDU71661.1 hypothetical protein Pan265_15130 [Mucisphaera calidilacus]
MIRTQRHQRRHTRHGFSLIEMLTAITVLAIVFTIVALVIASVRDTINLGGAQDEILSVAQVVERQFRDDLAHVNHDGFMVIRAGAVTRPTETDPGNADLVRIHRTDMLGFFANGKFRSTLDPTVEAPLAFIWYGHLRPHPFFSAFGSNDDLDNAPPFASPNIATAQLDYVDPHRWILGRRATLILPIIPQDTAGNPITHTASIWRNNDDHYNQATPANAPNNSSLYESDIPFPPNTPASTDIAIGSLASYKREILALSAAEQFLNLAYAASRRYGSRNYDITAAIDGQLPLVAATLAPYCSSFRIEYAIDADNSGGVDVVRPSNSNTANRSHPTHIQWHALNPTERDNAYGSLNSADASVGDIRIFGYDLSYDDTGTGTGATYNPGSALTLLGEGLEPDTGDEISGIYTAWPRLLRITMTLHDAKGYLHQQHLDSVEVYEDPDTDSGYQISGEPDGQRLQLILRLPPPPAN